MSGGMQSGGVSKELLTTKGDTHGFSNVNERVGIGLDSQVLTADSSEALGLKWSTPTDIAPPTTTKGDLSGFSTAQARIPVSATNGLVLTTDSTVALGLGWASIPASEGDGSIVGTCNYPRLVHLYEDFAYKDVSQAGFTSKWGYGNTSDATVQINTTGGGLSVENATGGRVYTAAVVAQCPNATADGITQSVLPFNQTGSIWESSIQWKNSNRPNTSNFGLTGSIARGDAAGADSAFFVNSGSYTNWIARTIDNASAQNDTDTGIVAPTNLDKYILKVECKASTIDFSIDGVLVATSSLKLPSTKLGCVWGLQNNAASSVPGKFNINWVEAYDT